MKVYLEDVFKKSGVPTYTFVKPLEYNKILVSLRTKGRGIVVEGPSGIGKTTSIQKVIDELGIHKKVTKLSARKKEDIEYINLLPDWVDAGTVIVDDFHVLTNESKSAIANHMKILADEERENDQLILIGINKAGDTLVRLAADLNNRIDTIKLESNPDEKIEELIKYGEEALNIEFSTKDEIIALSNGSFHIAQFLCNEICTYDGVLENQLDKKKLDVSIEVIKEKVLAEFARTFYHKAKAFAVGSRLRREGRAPYLHLLFWLSKADDWSINLDDILRKYPEHKLSIGQVVDKGFLEVLIRDSPDIQDVIHFDVNSRMLTIEDPKFMFYLRNLLWSKFAIQVGYVSITFESKYDFALSFAGENRDLAERISQLLMEEDVAVFYDKNEQHRILSENVEDYLAPIYSSEARFVIPLLSNSYPKKIWTKFESDNFKQRFGTGSIIPVWYSDSIPGIFDESRMYGGITFDVQNTLDKEAKKIVDALLKKLREERIYERKLAEI